MPKKLLTFHTPCVRMNLPVKKGSFFAAIFQPRAGIVVARFLNFLLAGVIQGGNF